MNDPRFSPFAPAPTPVASSQTPFAQPAPTVAGHPFPPPPPPEAQAAPQLPVHVPAAAAYPQAYPYPPAAVPVYAQPVPAYPQPGYAPYPAYAPQPGYPAPAPVGYPGQPVNVVVQNNHHHHYAQGAYGQPAAYGYAQSAYGMVPVPQYGGFGYGLVRTGYRNRWAYILLALLLGGFGVHKFYAGRVGMGVVYLLLCWTGVPAVLALVEALIAMIESDHEFDLKHNAKLL